MKLAISPHQDGHEEGAATLARPICVRARGKVNDIMPLSRRDPIAFAAALCAWTQARERAGVMLDGLSLVKTHDCLTSAEILKYAAMTERRLRTAIEMIDVRWSLA